MAQRPPLPPFTAQTAAQKVRAAEADRKFRWDSSGPRPQDHPGLSDLGL